MRINYLEDYDNNTSPGIVVVIVGLHIQRIVLATEETTVTQLVSHISNKCHSRSWSQRGTQVDGSHHGDNPLLKPTGIQIATKSLPGPTNREHRKLVGVKTMSLRTNYSFYCLMCCPTNKVIKTMQNVFSLSGGLDEDKLCNILQLMTPTNVKTVHQTFSFHIKNNLDRPGFLSPTHG